MSITVVVGAQYGSESKGKVTSFLSDEFDVAVRTGSPNAGHTVYHDDEVYKLQQIPATFSNKNCTLCIGAGALIRPEVLQDEVANTKTKQRLLIDPQAGIITDKHPKQEKKLVEDISSTGEGCGAALIDRLWRDDFSLAKDVLADDFTLEDISHFVNKRIDDGEKVVLESTQGYGLSIYHGDYPHVTSRDTTAAGFLSEAGLSPQLVEEIILVVRTYPIRVGGPSGPLPNEITWEELSKRVGREVEERTTTTNRPRRVAEFDPDLVRQSIETNRPTSIALQFLNYKFPEDWGKTTWKSLSEKAKDYVSKFESDFGVPVSFVGTGPENHQMIDRR